MRRPSLLCALPCLLLPACAPAGTTVVRPADTATAGAKGVGDPLFPAMGNGGYQVEHYGLSLTYEPKDGGITATAEIGARTDRALSSFSLDFHGLQVDGATIDGTPATVARTGDALRLTPAKELAADTAFTAVVTYHGAPETLTDPDGSQEGWLKTPDGAVALGEPNGSMAWFPGNHHPSDKAAYDLTVSVPEGMTAVSNGELSKQQTANGRTSFTWHTAEPMASYLATVAIGSFTLDRTAAGTVPQTVAIHTAQAQRAADVPSWVAAVTDWGARLFGPYPFSSTGATIGSGPSIDYALETQTRPYFNHAPDEISLVHEIAHQWFGDSVTPGSWQDMWLNEGFATYAEWLWQEQHAGPTAADTFAEYYALPKTDDLWSFPPAKPPSAEDVSGDPVYYRGAMTLHRLRETVGDATFSTILRTWTTDHRHGNVRTTDFTDLCTKVAGKDLAPLFQKWLYTSGKPTTP
ncbi:M1 family metallopeptidase [Streptomyces huiliensis]|uniref:M1 family metallopeptidase n=1 Tax=Streptomyces huiliensis TaxID=2876027 RepID=UPI001CBF312D|nr:M1 family metallopeptidase [Streptomyces huiliensis]MBZ4318508.1 M1 family metallopeptidase [Streptomyces huiliensis]